MSPPVSASHSRLSASRRGCVSHREPGRTRCEQASSRRRVAQRTPAKQTSKRASERLAIQSAMHLKGIGHSTRQQATAAGNETQRDLESHRSINAQQVRRRQTTHALATAPSPRRPASSRHAAPPLADTPPHPPVCVSSATSAWSEGRASKTSRRRVGMHTRAEDAQHQRTHQVAMSICLRVCKDTEQITIRTVWE